MAFLKYTELSNSSYAATDIAASKRAAGVYGGNVWAEFGISLIPNIFSTIINSSGSDKVYRAEEDEKNTVSVSTSTSCTKDFREAYSNYVANQNETTRSKFIEAYNKFKASGMQESAYKSCTKKFEDSLKADSELSKLYNKA